jgi:hypothetical protein
MPKAGKKTGWKTGYVMARGLRRTARGEAAICSICGLSRLFIRRDQYGDEFLLIGLDSESRRQFR